MKADRLSLALWLLRWTVGQWAFNTRASPTQICAKVQLHLAPERLSITGYNANVFTRATLGIKESYNSSSPGIIGCSIPITLRDSPASGDISPHWPRNNRWCFWITKYNTILCADKVVNYEIYLSFSFLLKALDEFFKSGKFTLFLLGTSLS